MLGYSLSFFVRACLQRALTRLKNKKLIENKNKPKTLPRRRTASLERALTRLKKNKKHKKNTAAAHARESRVGVDALEPQESVFRTVCDMTV